MTTHDGVPLRPGTPRPLLRRRRTGRGRQVRGLHCAPARPAPPGTPALASFGDPAAAASVRIGKAPVSSVRRRRAHEHPHFDAVEQRALLPCPSTCGSRGAEQETDPALAVPNGRKGRRWPSAPAGSARETTPFAPARATETDPCSSGSRSDCSTRGVNSGASSRNSTPWWASDTSPGTRSLPPPGAPRPRRRWWGARERTAGQQHSCSRGRISSQRPQTRRLERGLGFQRRQRSPPSTWHGQGLA